MDPRYTEKLLLHRKPYSFTTEAHAETRQQHLTTERMAALSETGIERFYTEDFVLPPTKNNNSQPVGELFSLLQQQRS